MNTQMIMSNNTSKVVLNKTNNISFHISRNKNDSIPLRNSSIDENLRFWRQIPPVVMQLSLH